MEKRRPHYPLEVVRGLAADPATCRLTRSAVEGGAVMGFSVAEVRAVVAALGRGDFYKSMTTYHDATLRKTCTARQRPAGRSTSR